MNLKDMGSLGDGNGETGPTRRKSFDLGHGGDTQLLDSQLSPSTLPANEEMVNEDPIDLNFVESTIQYEDTVPVDGESETQIVNPDEEAQAVNFDVETQIIDSQEDCVDYLETQILDEFATQAVIDNEREETYQMEVVDVGDDSADDDSIGIVSGGSVDCKKMQFNSPCKKGENREKADDSSRELCGSGSPPRSFTSIRTASIRAAGLAARSASTNQSDSGSYNVLSSSRSSEETALKINGFSHVTVSSKLVKEVDQDEVARKLDDKVEELRDGNKCKIGSTAVRRLFSDNTDLEANRDSLDKGEEEHNLAGLSYIDSQEPGALSQANALDFVDQFLKDNIDDLCQDFGAKVPAVGKSASLLSARGPQILAANRAAMKETAIYDWDDNMEDECGGDFFCRRKNDFFNGESTLKSWIQPQKKQQGGRLDECKHSNEHEGPQVKIRGLVRSTPLVKFNSRGKIEKNNKTDDRCSKKYLEEESSAEPIGEPLRGHTEGVCTVGFDTQLAAEAMEALCRDEGLIDKDERDDEELQYHGDGRKKSLEPPSKCTRRSNRRDGSNAEVRKKSPISRRRSSRTIENRKQTTLEQTRTGELDILCGNGEVNRGKLDEKLEEVGKVGGSVTPVAHRTRLSKAARESLGAESLPSNLHRETNGTAESGADQVEDVPSKQSVGLEGNRKPVPRRKRSRNDGTGTNSNGMKKTRLSKWKMGIEGSALPKSAEDSSTKADRNPSSSAKNMEAEAKFNESRQERSDVSPAACITPPCCPTPSNDASPVCAGSEYFNQSCRKNLSRSSLWKEVKSLTALSGPTPSPAKDTRKRWRDMADVRVLYSHHLDEDTIKQQKKILGRLGASEASSISDATHFVTDQFVRTRNMLEAIAVGKPVVTHLWLEGCGQAGCFLDEKTYILRDAKKEKEIGFSMPVSLSRASQHQLLRDQRVLITASVKPSKEIISSLVKAVGGQPAERVGRSALRNEKIPEELLILSCEEDYDICLPFLEKGASVYSSELLLNGIVIQKLEYERHRLFADNMKRTRSTVWLKKEGRKFVPIASKHNKK